MYYLAVARLSLAQSSNIISDNYKLSQYTPNIVLVCLTFLLRIQEFRRPLIQRFSWFSSLHQG
jgi:hypothetical protein